MPVGKTIEAVPLTRGMGAAGTDGATPSTFVDVCSWPDYLAPRRELIPVDRAGGLSSAVQINGPLGTGAMPRQHVPSI
jgi:hypothetical protein